MNMNGNQNLLLFWNICVITLESTLLALVLILILVLLTSQEGECFVAGSAYWTRPKIVIDIL